MRQLWKLSTNLCIGLVWKSVLVTCCIHQLMLQEGFPTYIVSPGYDTGAYPRNIHCKWNIFTQAKHQVTLSPVHFEVEIHSNCLWDYIQVYNGTCGTGSLSAKRYCGASLSTIFTSAGNSLCLEFVSDASIVKLGFKIFASAARTDKHTGKTTFNATFIRMKRIATSPTTLSHLETSPPSSLSISSSLSSLLSSSPSPSSSSSTSQLSSLSSSTSSSSPSLSQVTTAPVETNNIQTITVDPEDAVGDVTVEMCADVHTIKSGIQGQIVSPEFTPLSSYGRNLKCKLQVNNPNELAVEFKFLHFDVESHFKCQWDNLTISDAASANLTHLAVLCGNQLPADIRSLSTRLLLTFTSDYIVGRTGFKIQYRILNNDISSVISPTVSSKVITLSDSNVYISSGNTIYPDIYETLPPKSFQSNILLSSSPVSMVTADYDEVSSKEKINTIEMCNGKYFAEVQEVLFVTSPNYGEGKKYPLNINCNLTLTSSENQNITLEFVQFEVEYHQFCIWDSLRVYDGANRTFPLKGRLCGNKKGYIIESSQNFVYLDFVSDFVVTRKGFEIKVTAKPAKSKVQLLPSTVFDIQSTSMFEHSNSAYSSVYLDTSTSLYSTPYLDTTSASFLYSTPYLDTTSASYLYSTPYLDTTSASSLYSTPYLDTTSASSLYSTPYLNTAIYTEPDTNYFLFSLLSSFVESTFTPPPYFSSSVMPIHRSTPSPDANSIVSICSKQDSITVRAILTIMSPNYGHNKVYPSSQDCAMQISGTKLLMINFTKFQMELHSSCGWDYLQIFNGSSESAPSLGKYCGVKDNYVLLSVGPVLFLRFVTDQSVQHSGFMITISEIHSGDPSMLTKDNTVKSTPFELSSPASLSSAEKHVSDTNLITDKRNLSVSSSSIYKPSPTAISSSHSDLPIASKTVPNGITANEITSFSISKISLSVSSAFDSSLALPVENLEIQSSFSAYNNFQSESSATAVSHKESLSVSLIQGHGSSVASTTLTTLAVQVTSTTIEISESFQEHVKSPLSSPQTSFSKKLTSFSYITSTLPKHLPATASSYGSRFGHAVSTSPLTTTFLEQFTSSSFTLKHTTSSLVVSVTEHTMSPSVTGYTTTISPTYISTQTVIDEIKMCSGTESVTLVKDIVIKSPNYGVGNYPFNAICVLKATALNNQIIRLEILDMDIEYHSSCWYDRLDVYDGLDRSYPLIARYCGATANPVVIFSSGDTLYLSFFSDGAIIKRGFKASLKVVTTSTKSPIKNSVTSTLTNQHAAISTTITTNSKSQNVTMSSIANRNEESTPSSSTISSIIQITTPITYITTPSVSTTKTSPYNETSDNLSESTTDKAETISTDPTTLPTVKPLPLECSGVPKVYTASRGFIQLPEEGKIKDAILSDIMCEWVIIAESDHTIKLTFLTFDVTCEHGNITVYEGQLPSNKVLGTYCGSDVPNETTTFGTVLTLKLLMDGSENNYKFEVNYTVIRANTPLKNCLSYQFPCKNGECIPDIWLCDGEADCSGAEDEENCGHCQADEYRCVNGKCIPSLQLCNDRDDCSQGEDELSCVRLREDAVQVMHNGVWYYVCLDSWTNVSSDAVCHYTSFGYSESSGSVASSDSDTVFMSLKAGHQQTPGHKLQDLFEPVLTCPSRRHVTLQCYDSGCGIRSNNVMAPYIFGSTKSYGGQWPWMAAIKINKSFICGGTLISPQWVVTASHCIETVSKKPYLMNVLLGSIAVDPSNAIHHKVSEVIQHPHNNYIYNADIALLKLQKPAQLSDFVTPLCLRSEIHKLTENSLCYVAGWGVKSMNDYYATIMPKYLHHVKMRLYNQTKCMKSYQAGKIKDTMICAGYQMGGIDTCKGDSGGPLMCKLTEDRWVLAGITSWGETPCGQAGKPGVYTRVEKYKEWVLDTIQNQGISYNCSFESPDICGYRELSNSKFMWLRRSGKPTLDYTFNTVLGHFLYAEVFSAHDLQGDIAVLRMPTINTGERKCLSFAIFFYGAQIDIVLRVKGQGSEEKILFEVTSFSSEWRLANITIPSNVSRIEIQAVGGSYGNTGVAVDDVTLTQKSCEDFDNVTCSFDENNLCNYDNEDDDMHDWELLPAPFQSETGFYLAFTGAKKSIGNFARVSSSSIKGWFPRCLRFKYYVCPVFAGKLKVLTQTNFGGTFLMRTEVWAHQLFDCSGWNIAVVQIQSMTHEFSVAFEAERGALEGKIGIDDITMIDGNCF